MTMVRDREHRTKITRGWEIPWCPGECGTQLHSHKTQLCYISYIFISYISYSHCKNHVLVWNSSLLMFPNNPRTKRKWVSWKTNLDATCNQMIQNNLQQFIVVLSGGPQPIQTSLMQSMWVLMHCKEDNLGLLLMQHLWGCGWQSTRTPLSKWRESLQDNNELRRVSWGDQWSECVVFLRYL